MIFSVFAIVDVETFVFEPLDLNAGVLYRKEVIVRAVSDQPIALVHLRVHFPQKRFRIVAVPADADVTGKAVCMSCPELQRQKAALRKAKQESVLRWKAVPGCFEKYFRQ